MEWEDDYDFFQSPEEHYIARRIDMHPYELVFLDRSHLSGEEYTWAVKYLRDCQFNWRGVQQTLELTYDRTDKAMAYFREIIPKLIYDYHFPGPYDSRVVFESFAAKSV